MTMDLKQWRLETFSLAVFRKWAHALLSYPHHLSDLVSSALCPLPAEKISNLLFCHFLCNSHCFLFLFVSYVFLKFINFLIYFLLSMCLGVCRSCLHTPYLRLVFSENFSSGTQCLTWNPGSPFAQPRMSIFDHMIFLSGFYVAMVRLMFWARAKPILLLRVKRREMEFHFQISVVERKSRASIKFKRCIQPKCLYLIFLDCPLLS